MIVQNNKYSRKLTFLAVSLLLSICFVFFTSAQGLSTEGTPGIAPKLPTDALKAMYDAQFLMFEDQFDAAIARLNEYLATRPPDVPAQVYMQLGACWHAKEGFEEARKAFEKAYEIDPTVDIVALNNYAAFDMDKFGFDVTQVDKLPSYLHRVFPVYPHSAKTLGIPARVKIACLVDKDGFPQKIKAIECDPEDAIDIFGPPAVEAVKEWRFNPGEIGGDPVQTRVAFWIIFELHDMPDEATP
jgi:tetratricopeptide (TPR) repeat protein